MVDIRNVSFSYSGQEGSPSLKELVLQIKPGQCVLLCGSSGCGKTTVTKLINGLIPHFDQGRLDGTVLVDDMEVAKTPLYQLSQTVGSVFQNPKSQFFNIDSDSELAFGLENNGVPPEQIRQRIRRVVQELKLSHLLHRNVFSMSGGEKQSLAFASVYAMDPEVYVLDEPSANLDQAATEALRAQIRTIKAQGKTVIIAEHRLCYLADLIDRAILIENGAICQEYTREEFLALTEEQRHALGLRTICTQQEKVNTPPSERGVLEVRGLTVKLKKQTILQNLSFTASPGQVLGILGRNGAGKSTLLRCLAGLQKEASGQILFRDSALNRRQRSRLCYLIMQDVNHQLFGESVWEECMLSCSQEHSEDEISRALDDFDLLQFRDQHPMALSGGQKQRLAIVTGLLAGKQVLMFDEPTSGLDYAHMYKVSRLLRQLSDSGHIVIVVTHDMELLNSTCDQVLHFPVP